MWNSSETSKGITQLVCCYFGSKVMKDISEQLSELEQMVREMVLASLGVEKYLDEHMNSSTYMLRVLKNSAPQTEDSKLGVVPHTDGRITTVLYQIKEVGGLEIETKDEK
ncbi:hypothetical protein K1719_021517 [Acacia pycnantha]|nr:hypothetical protein K1719_021517 [Acacia pycnantha]